MDLTGYAPPPWVVWLAGGVCAVIATWMVARVAIRAGRAAWKTFRADAAAKTDTARAGALEDWLTRCVAAIATGVSAEGMWRFTRDVLGFDGVLQVALFAFIELAMVTEAVRARRNMREHFSAGLDGVAVWVLAGLTAVLSTMDAKSVPEAVFRLAAPLVAAWMWERGMRLERHRRRGTTGINWRLTPERVLVWLGLAESRDRTASEVDVHRRLKRVALAAKKVHQLREAGAVERKLRAAVAKRDRMLDMAVEHTDLATNPRTQEALLDVATTLGGAEDLSALLATARAPWRQLDHPAITGADKYSKELELAAAMREWSDAIKSQHDPEVSAAVTSMAAYIARRPVEAMRPLPEIAQERDDDTTGRAPHSQEGSTWLGQFKPWTRATPKAPDVDPDTTATRTEPRTEPLTPDSSEREEQREHEREDADDRRTPSDQVNRAAEEWIRRQCRGQNGVGRRPTWREVGDKYGFSDGWGGKRVRAVQERMSAQGYEFRDDGTVIAPRKSLTEPLTVVNGSGPETEVS
jgi:hypothetical protein